MAEVEDCTSSESFVSVIGAEFCVPYPIDIVVNKNGHSLKGGNFVITDVNDEIMFKVQQNNSALHNRRLLLDAADNPIAYLQEKIWTEHCKWQVFRGERKEQSELIFSSTTPLMIQSRTDLNVYLANNTKEKLCDFKIEGSWSNRASTFYTGDSATIIAQMHMRTPAGSNMVLWKDKFLVTISPNVDQAFIVALIAIFEGTRTDMATTYGVLMVGAAVGAS